MERKIILPDKTTATLLLSANTTAKDAIVKIMNAYNLPFLESDYQLFATGKEGDIGTWLTSSDNLPSGGSIEVKNAPYTVHLVLSDGTDSFVWDFDPRKNPGVKLQVDFSDPLMELMPLAQRSLKLRKGEEYIFKTLNLAAKRTRWLNVNISLEEQDVLENGYLLLTPVSILNRKSTADLTAEASGWLIKSSVKEGKTTREHRRWCMIEHNFFYYFKSQDQKTPSGVVPLEYYTLSQQREGGFELIHAGRGFSRSHPNYLLTFEQRNSPAEAAKWINTLRRRCVNGAGKTVFGISIGKILSRKSHKGSIPSVVERTIQFLQAHLNEEGLFRKSGSASAVAQFRADFDSGIDVDLKSSCRDPHAVAGLLKLWLRELPEPLLTFEAFNDFLVVAELPEMARVEALRGLFEELPGVNLEILQVLLPFLHKVSLHAEKNLMKPSNLAIVFGPNLLTPSDNSPQNVAALTPAINSIVEYIICEAPALVCPEASQLSSAASSDVAASGDSSSSSSSSSWGAANTNTLTKKDRIANRRSVRSGFFGRGRQASDVATRQNTTSGRHPRKPNAALLSRARSQNPAPAPAPVIGTVSSLPQPLSSAGKQGPPSTASLPPPPSAAPPPMTIEFLATQLTSVQKRLHGEEKKRAALEQQVQLLQQQLQQLAAHCGMTLS